MLNRDTRARHEAPGEHQVSEWKFKIVANHAGDLARPVIKVFESLFQQECLRFLLDYHSDAEARKISLDLRKFSLQQADDVLFIQAIKDDDFIYPAHKSRPESVVHFLKRYCLAPRQLDYMLAVEEKPDSPADKLIGFLPRQIAYQNHKRVAKRKRAGFCSHYPAVNRQRQVIAKSRRRFIDLLEDHYVEGRSG